MENINKYQQHCPGADDYRTFLHDTGDSAFKAAFQLHLDACELCREAIEGYRITHSVPEQPAVNEFIIDAEEKKNNRRYLYILGSVAAALVFTAGWWALKNSSDFESLYFDNQVMNEISPNASFKGVNKIGKQLPENYWYICNSDVFINDQEVDSDDIGRAIDQLDASKSIIIQVGCTCDEQVNQLIDRIKSQKQITIITYSKGGQVKPKRS